MHTSPRCSPFAFPQGFGIPGAAAHQRRPVRSWNLFRICPAREKQESLMGSAATVGTICGGHRARLTQHQHAVTDSRGELFDPAE